MSRQNAAENLGKVQVGQDAMHVHKLLGDPDRARMRVVRGPNGAVVQVPQWEFGVSASGRFATYGTVRFALEGGQWKVTRICGHKGTPPADDLLPEEALKELLEHIHLSCGGLSMSLYEPTHFIKAANGLHAIGKAKARAVISEYLRVTMPDDESRDGVHMILRVLFCRTTENALPLFPVQFEEKQQAVLKEAMPMWPMLVIDDVPLMLGPAVTPSLFVLRGHGPSEAHVARFFDGYEFRATPLSLPMNPSELALRVFDSKEWLNLEDVVQRREGKALSELVMSEAYDQLLRLVRTIYRDRSQSSVSLDVSSERRLSPRSRWNDAVNEIRQLDVRWDNVRSRYSFVNGLVLDSEPWQHR